MGKFMPIPSCQFLNLDGRQLETDCRMAKHPEIALISKFVLFLPPELDELAAGFLGFFGTSAIAALHPGYDSPGRVDQIVKEVADRVQELLAADPAADSLSRFADEPGIRLMNIHKSKGLEFEAVAVMAVERETYWGDPGEARAILFVGISRARKRLLLTHARTRERPAGAWRWDVYRTPHEEFLGYAREPV